MFASDDEGTSESGTEYEGGSEENYETDDVLSGEDEEILMDKEGEIIEEIDEGGSGEEVEKDNVQSA